MSITIKRIAKECKELMSSDNENLFKLKCAQKNILDEDYNTVLEDDLFNWEGYIIGPEETPWEGKKINVLVTLPENYPMNPPKVTIKNKLYHPNISLDGGICLEVLRSSPNGNWTPSMTITKVLLCLLVLLKSPNTSDPLNQNAAVDYDKNRELYFSKAVSTFDSSNQ